jgi:hypothetical protein
VIVIAAKEASVVVVLAVAAMSSAGAAGLDQLEAEAVSVAVASAQQPRRSVACADPLEWERAEAELASAYRAILHLERVRRIGRLSIMDELADPYLRPLAQEQRLVGLRIVSAQHAILLGNGQRQRPTVQPSLQRRVHLEQLHTED